MKKVYHHARPGVAISLHCTWMVYHLTRGGYIYKGLTFQLVRGDKSLETLGLYIILHDAVYHHA